MTFEVPARRVERRHRGVPMLAVPVAGIAIVAAAVLTGGRPAASGSVGAGPARAEVSADLPAVANAPTPIDPTPSDETGPPAAVPVLAPPRAIPANLACEGVDGPACRRIARAALRVLPADLPAVSEATVLRSLLCGETSDCPARYLDDGLPLGSVIVTFDDGGPRAAINVVEWRFSDAIRLGPRAWIVDWMPG